MAKAQKAPVASTMAVFNSVFPSSRLKPPAQQQRFSLSRGAYEGQHVKTLTECSRVILGIGDEDRALIRTDDVFDADYKPHYPSCMSMVVIPQFVEAAILDRPPVREARHHVLELMRAWKRDLGGDSARKAFARVLDEMLTEFVNWAYAGTYEEESEVIDHLRYWIRSMFATYVIQVLDALQDNVDFLGRSSLPEISSTDIQRWEEMAITRLGALRVEELFDIIVDWDATPGTIDDLKHYTTNPGTRSYLASNFISILSTRLLHPGASTIEILQLYISIIRAFRRLDPKGVLLDRVARMIRRYLRDREDTVKVIVSGLLSDVVDSDDNPVPPNPDHLTELALELQRHDIENSRDDDGELDWNNMDWVPDPIDAAPDYKKSKNTDIIGSLISIFESKDVFVKELQTTLADRLLKNKVDFDQEISVLEHLKLRFGDSALQACEIMLRDVIDSRKVDSIIRQDQGLQSATGKASEVDLQLHAKILSRLFWPTLQEQSFKVPPLILEQQARYEVGFEALKQSRKLTWLNALGQVEVELDLEDRVFQGEVLPWQAAVIHAFQSVDTITTSGTSGTSASRTVNDLAEELGMSPAFVRSACIFWLSKRILAESAPDTYTVLETLPEGDQQGGAMTTPTVGAIQADSAAVAAEATAAFAVQEAEEAARQQQMAMYHQFVLSMLTNQGAMPLPRIAMMLGIVVPGGFPFSNEELKEFLGGMVRDGQLDMGHAGVYKVVQQ